MFTNMGVPNGEMSLFTSLLYLPWVIKPLWSPFVDIIRTKRWWVLAMQVLMSLAFIVTAFTLPASSEISAGDTPISLFTVTLILFWITAFASATHDIAADGFYMLALNPGDQTYYVGIRSTFYRMSSIFGQGVLVMFAGYLERTTGNIPSAWSMTLLTAAVLFAAITFWHLYRLPKPSSDRMRSESMGPKVVATELKQTIFTFFRKKHILIALLFMLLYRLPEAFLIKMMDPFLLNSVEQGGLGLSTEIKGLVYGTIGVAALTLGGILGGMAASKWGLKKSLLPMALALTLPCLSFVFLAIFQPQNIGIISACVAFDQFGYGFGFTAYMLYLIYFSEGEYKTAHYSLCTAFMALSMMLPGLVAGYIQEWLGYTNFFIFVMACCLVTMAVTLSLKVDPEYGKSKVNYNMKKTLIVALVAVGAIVACGIIKAPSTSQTQPSGSSAPGSRTGFALSFFQTVNTVSPKGENVIVSPYSAGAALSMLEAGAYGETKVEFDNALNGKLFTSENLGGKGAITIESANSVWISDDFSVRNGYVNTLEKDFDALVGNYDFSDPATVRMINDWCSEHTNGKISDIIDRLSPDMALVLVNALYFNAPWEKAFNPELTHKDIFYGSQGEDKIDMMYKKDTYQYAECQGFQFVRIPYAGGRYSMYVVLPPKDMDIDSAVVKLDENLYNEAMALLAPEEVMLTMPKFKLETSMVLNESLEKMGVKSAFGPAADFSGISESGRLQLNLVKQKCYIDVSEKGTEAAAVTSAQVRLTSLEPQTIMNVDRPFCFIIADRENANMLFVGKIVDLE